MKMGGANMASALLVVLLLSTAVSSDFVPVLFIGSDSDNVPPAPKFPLQKISSHDFDANYIKKLVGKGPVVVFVQDTLSLEDFDEYGNAYGDAKESKSSFSNLQDLLDKKPFLLLEAVRKPEESFRNLQQDWDVVTVTDPNSSFEFLKAKISPKTLVIVRLPPTQIAPNRSEALKKNDEIIGRFTKQVGEKSEKFTVLYTAQQPSWTLDQSDRIRTSRHILETEMISESGINGTILYDNNNLTLLFTQDVTYYVSKANNKSVTIEVALSDLKANATEVGNDTIIFNIESSPGNENLTSIEIKIEFVKENGNWFINSVKVLVESTYVSGPFNMTTNEKIWAPLDYSYNCKKPGYFQNGDQTETAFSIYFDSLQVQPFLKKLSFSYPYDCIGFFTIPILEGAFVTIIFILILAWGVYQTSTIHTMDRFDDAKSKPITVPTVD